MGGILAPQLIAWVIGNVSGFGLAPWRWVFLITGALGLVWTIWWAREYFPPAAAGGGPGNEAQVSCESGIPEKDQSLVTSAATHYGIAELMRFRETWGIVGAKFLTDAAWYFYMFGSEVSAGRARG
jgi:ACS family hexuronate transporter-like MFS transporter